MRLYLIRHPRPMVAHDICYGASDLAVSADEQARVTSLLAPVLPQGIPVYSSPLRRCAEFAARLAKKLGSDAVVRDARLAEMNFGAWEMRNWNDIPRSEIDAWADRLVDYCPGGGESVMQVMLRINAFLLELRDQGIGEAAVVCHAGTIRLLLALKNGVPPADAAQAAAESGHQIGYGDMLRLDIV